MRSSPLRNKGLTSSSEDDSIVRSKLNLLVCELKLFYIFRKNNIDVIYVLESLLIVNLYTIVSIFIQSCHP